MNQTIYRDFNKNAIRFSEIKKMKAETLFAGLGIKYVALGAETYYANNKNFVVGNRSTADINNMSESKQFSVFPNPAHDEINITADKRCPGIPITL